jgi:hypothetical protein
MPAILTIGMSTGVRIIRVGAKSSAVPTITTSTIITNMSVRGLSMNGVSMAAICCGTVEVVMSQADNQGRGDQEDDDRRRLGGRDEQRIERAHRSSR